jgi:peptidoglycan/xylan/chitin deacetylase (PgdA/CDA1 family)
MYHDVVPPGAHDSSGFTGPGPDRYKLSRLAFATHLEAIEAAGLQAGVVTEADARLYLTFDDGGSSAAWIGETLAARGFRGHFFVTTARLGTPGFVDPGALRELRAQGHVVGSHSHTHAALSRLTQPEIRAEWETSRSVLEDALDEEVRTASVPGGFFSSVVAEEAAQLGFQHLFVSEPRLGSRDSGGLRVHGRFAVYAGTSPARIAALCRLSRPAVLSAWLGWRARTAARAVLGQGYVELRRFALARRR